MKTGDIYLVNLNPTMGHEIKKTRPVVVLNPGHKKNLQLAIVVPITSWHKQWENNPFFLILPPTLSTGLSKKSAVDCFQIKAISHKRFTSKIGGISDDQLDTIKQALSLILDIEPEHCL